MMVGFGCLFNDMRFFRLSFSIKKGGGLNMLCPEWRGIQQSSVAWALKQMFCVWSCRPKPWRLHNRPSELYSDWLTNEIFMKNIRQLSLIVSFMTGRCGLKGHLRKLWVVEYAACRLWFIGEESAEHILTEYYAYKTHWEQLFPTPSEIMMSYWHWQFSPGSWTG